MNRTALLVAASLLALPSGFSLACAPHPTAVSQPGHFVKRSVISARKGLKTLYDQNSDDAGASVVSQSFDSSFDSYDSQAADDFVVPSGTKWKIKEIDVTGVYFNGAGPATSVETTIYTDGNGAPAHEVISPRDACSGLPTGKFACEFVKPLTLKPGTYWISVVADLGGPGAGGEWGWEVNGVQHNNQAVWQNPGGGFGTGCSKWATLKSCLGYGPDLMFAIKGKAK